MQEYEGYVLVRPSFVPRAWLPGDLSRSFSIIQYFSIFLVLAPITEIQPDSSQFEGRSLGSRPMESLETAYISTYIHRHDVTSWHGHQTEKHVCNMSSMHHSATISSGLHIPGWVV